MSEVWKPIKGYEGFYEVSDRGNVRSLDRKIIQLSKYGTMMEKRYPGIVLTPNDNGHGYKMVGLRDSTSGKKKNHPSRKHTDDLIVAAYPILLKPFFSGCMQPGNQ